MHESFTIISIVWIYKLGPFLFHADSSQKKITCLYKQNNIFLICNKWKYIKFKY